MISKFKTIIVVVFTFLPSIIMAQCTITLDEATHIDCYGDNTGAISVNVASSPATTLYFWTGPLGFSSVIKDISNLLAGDYQLIVNETSTSCVDTFNYTVQQPLQITVEFTLSGLCVSGDSADVSTLVYGGTPPYTYSWSTGVSTPSTTGLLPGSYWLHITDKNGCDGWGFLTVSIPPPLQIFMSIADADCKDDNTGSIQAFATGGMPPYDFYWPDNIIDLDKANTSILGELLEGTYAVEIIDEMGCILQDTATVIHNPKICLEVYSAFSPNEDSNHDFWQIKNIKFYPEALVEVYNRSGDRVFRRREYQNTLKDAFNGKVDGKRLPSATYYYIIDLENGDPPFTGTVTIVR
jgi:gliding motility-associated-like protein